MSTNERTELADEMNGWVVSSGYYGQSLGMEVALEIAEHLIEAGYGRVHELKAEVESLQDFQNDIACRIPEEYEDDIAQEAIIEKWLDDITAEPRAITTTEELDALPYGSVVLRDEGWGVTVAQRQAEDMRWYVTGCLEYIRPEAILPATVLHEPEPQS